MDQILSYLQSRIVDLPSWLVLLIAVPFVLLWCLRDLRLKNKDTTIASLKTALDTKDAHLAYEEKKRKDLGEENAKLHDSVLLKIIKTLEEKDDLTQAALVQRDAEIAKLREDTSILEQRGYGEREPNGKYSWVPEENVTTLKDALPYMRITPAILSSRGTLRDLRKFVTFVKTTPLGIIRLDDPQLADIIAKYFPEGEVSVTDGPDEESPSSSRLTGATEGVDEK